VDMILVHAPPRAAPLIEMRCESVRRSASDDVTCAACARATRTKLRIETIQPSSRAVERRDSLRGRAVMRPSARSRVATTYMT
jgi:hypothetical protein